MLTIGNVYAHGFDALQLARLESSGFSFRPEVSSYSGSQICHFLDFPLGPSLELIEVSDRSAYETFVPPGMEPYCPGVSLVVDDGSPEGLARFEQVLLDRRPYRLQVSYREEGGPGWHYLNLGEPLIPGTFLWLTAYDEPRPSSGTPAGHPNEARGVVGLVFDVPPEGLDALSRLVGSPVRNRRLRIGDIDVMAAGVGHDHHRFPLRAVVLQVPNLDAFGPASESAEATATLGRPTLRIETNPLSWDLWVTT